MTPARKISDFWYGLSCVAENRFRQRALEPFPTSRPWVAGRPRSPSFSNLVGTRKALYPADFVNYVDQNLIPLVQIRCSRHQALATVLIERSGASMSELVGAQRFHEPTVPAWKQSEWACAVPERSCAASTPADCSDWSAIGVLAELVARSP